MALYTMSYAVSMTGLENDGDAAPSRQRQVGAASRKQTQDRLLQAAGALFAERGYERATVSAIARRAGVTVQTLYLAWGSKRALLRAYLEAALASQAGPIGRVGDRFAGRGAREVVDGMAALVAAVAARSAPAWKLYRDAAAVDSQIAADWAQLQQLRRGTFDAIVRNIPAEALRSGLTREAARDTAWAIASPEAYEVLVRHAGYTLDEFERWMADTLAAALLANQSLAAPAARPASKR